MTSHGTFPSHLKFNLVRLAQLNTFADHWSCEDIHENLKQCESGTESSGDTMNKVHVSYIRFIIMEHLRGAFIFNYCSSAQPARGVATSRKAAYEDMLCFKITSLVSERIDGFRRSKMQTSGKC